MTERFVVITGASTGIGLDAARELIDHGYTVFGSVRRNEDADRVSNALGPRFMQKKPAAVAAMHWPESAYGVGSRGLRGRGWLDHDCGWRCGRY